MILKNARIILAEGPIKKGWLQIKQGLITKVSASNNCANDDAVLDLTGLKILPGFIDVHTHGGYGVAFEDASIESFSLYAQQILREGVTRFCQATVTGTNKNISQSLVIYKEWLANHNHGLQALQIGAHIEGPFISPIKKGAHPLGLLQKPSVAILKAWIKASDQNIRLITFAPELADKDFLRLLSAQNIVGSAGHSNISAQLFLGEIVPAGIHHVTHLFNGMSGVDQHHPGLAVGALINDSVLCEVISDGVHIKPDTLRLIYKCKGFKGITLITDSMRAKGMPDGNYWLGTLEVTVANGEAHLVKDGTIAGSVAQFDRCYRLFKKFNNLTDEIMIYMSSINAARQLGIFDKTGSIAVNKMADLVILNDQDAVVMTIVEGQLVYINEQYKKLFPAQLLGQRW